MHSPSTLVVCIYLVFYIMSDTSTCSWSQFCNTKYRPKASNYQLSHLRTRLEFELGSQRLVASELPLCHHGPLHGIV